MIQQAMTTPSLALPKLGYRSVSWLFLLIAAVALMLSDLAVSALNPWAEMRRLAAGLIRPDLFSIEMMSVVWTVAFAVLGVAIGASTGFLLALVFARLRAVRILCAFLRSVHELFWALLLIQIAGLSATTGILAVAIPYSGIFAKVFAEMIEEADLAAERVLPARTSIIARFAYARIPELAPQFWTYTLYRLECGMRSTLVLGFIGLPTIGFHLDSFFKQGHYREAAALLLAFYVLIGTRRLWARPSTVPILIIASVLVLPETIGGGSALANLTRFLTHDIIPTPLRDADLLAAATWQNLAAWLWPIITKQAVPGVIETLVLSQVALVAMGVIALILFPFICRHFAGRLGQPLGRIALVVVRSTPEYMLVYVLLQLLGPLHAAGHHRTVAPQRRHRRLSDGPARRRAGLSARRPERRQSLLLRNSAASLRPVPRLRALSMGDHPARECDLRHSGSGNARLLRRCRHLRVQARRCGRADSGHGAAVNGGRCLLPRPASTIAH